MRHGNAHTSVGDSSVGDSTVGDSRHGTGSRRRGLWAALLVVAMAAAACTTDPTSAEPAPATPSEGESAESSGPAAVAGGMTIEDAIADFEDYEEWEFEEGGVLDLFERNTPVPPPAPATGVEVRSQTSGDWSDGATWVDGRVPSAGDAVVVASEHVVTIDVDAEVDGATVKGSLVFAENATVTLASTQDIVIEGRLEMRPGDAEVEQIIEFRGIDESAAEGGGMAPNGDVGLWVIGGGQLDLRGAERTGWSRLTEGLERGASTIEVEAATGWRVGDEIVISPTRPVFASDDPMATFDGFHPTTIAAIDGTSITLADATTVPFPEIAGQYRAEVMNLTRNVIVRGTREGRAHVFVHTNQHPHSVRWVALDYMGPYDVLGRYPLHFHHGSTSVEGSLIEGVVVRSAGNHGFVIHESHGVTLRDAVAIDISFHHVYWWDESETTSDLVMEHVIAARYAYSGFFLGLGDNMALRDAVAVGALSNGSFGGFDWENKANGAWEMSDVIAHNNSGNGIRVWQNGQIPQVVDGFVAYHNTGAGIEHGAYTNRYTYRDLHLVGNYEAGLTAQAVTLAEEGQSISGPAITFADVVFDAGGLDGAPVLIHESALDAVEPIVFENVSFANLAPDVPLFHFEYTTPHKVRVIDSDLPDGHPVVLFDNVEDPANTWLEIIDDARSLRYRPVEVDPGATFDDATQAWVAEIDRPIPAGIGEGTGLLVEYFEDADLTELVFAEVLPSPLEQAWTDNGTPYHRIDTEDGAGARWSGDLEVEPGQGGRYELGVETDIGVRLWLDGDLLIDDPNNGSRLEATAGADLESGRSYELVIELYDRAGGGGINFYAFWERPDGTVQILPTSQLTPRDMPENDPIPVFAD